jgi:CHAT domain-containing protein/tetratricopeptide (TPR) repeat protein
MTRFSVALALGMTLAAGLCVVDAQPPRKLTPQERKDLEVRWNDLTSAAVKHYQAGRLAEATAMHEKALELVRQFDPEQDHLLLLRSLNNLAFVLRARGKHQATESLYHEALEVARRRHAGRDDTDLAYSLNNLGFAVWAQGKYAAAEPLFLETLEMRRRLFPNQDHPDVAESLNNLASVRHAQGNLTDAEQLFRDALDMRRRLHPRQDHAELARALDNLARVCQEHGEYAEGEALCREALDMRRRLYPKRDDPQIALSLNRLAGLIQARGQFGDAAAMFRESLQMYRRLYPRQDHPELANSLNNLGLVLRAQGKYEDAEHLFRDSLQMCHRLYPKQDHAQLAQALNNLAFGLEAQGKYADAEPLFRDALQMQQRLNPGRDQPDLAKNLNNLAYVLQAQGKYRDAEPLFRDALDMRRRLYRNQDHPDLASAMNNLAFLSLAQGRHAAAESLFRDGLRMYRGLAAAYAAVRSEGEALTLAASFPMTRDGFLSNAQALRSEPAAVYAELWASKAALARVYERRTLAARAAAADPRAAALLRKLTDCRRRRADLLLAPQPADPRSRDKRDEDLAGYARAIEALDDELRPLFPALAQAEKLARSSPADLQRVLPADAAVVDFLRYVLFEQDPTRPGKVGQKRTYSYLAFVLTRDKVAWVDLGPADPIENAIAAWREAITTGKEVLPELAAKVRALAWAKVRQEVPAGTKVVYVCPDLALCRLPWAALPGDRPGTVLLDDHAVAVLPHASFLLAKQWSQDRLPRHAAGIVVVGEVAYDADPATAGPVALNRGELPLTPEQKARWPALPGAAAEARGVASAAGKENLNPRMLGGEKASTSAVLEALPKARYAHLATHGFFADASFRSAFQVDPTLFETSWRGERIGAGALSPLVMTGLVLAGANRPNTPGRGVLTGEALVDLDLSGLELAVLSACETGLGDVAGGEGTFGLQRAFHLAGTRDVIASLWKVPDRPTAALMALFYRNLWEKEMPPAEALRQAQLEIYRHPERIAPLAEGFRGNFTVVPGSAEAPLPPGPDGKAHPRLWAAFTLSGPGR